jgi:hypothetical protein
VLRIAVDARKPNLESGKLDAVRLRGGILDPPNRLASAEHSPCLLTVTRGAPSRTGRTIFINLWIIHSDINFRHLQDPWEKLVREQGAGSGERGAGISSPNDLKFWRPWQGRPITVDNKCVDFYKILKAVSITVVIKMGTEGGK